MKQDYPSFHRSKEKVTVELFPTGTHTRIVTMSMAVDRDRYGDVIGIEIIGAIQHGGQNLFHGIDWDAINKAGQIRFSYGKVSDILNVWLEADRSLGQGPVDGRLIVDPSGRLVGIEVDLTPHSN